MKGLSYDKIPILKKIYMVLFVVLPIINQYQFFSLTFLQIYTLFGVCVWILNNRKLIIDRGVMAYIFYVIIISLVGYTIAGDSSVTRIILRMVSFVLLTVNFYVIFPKMADFSYIYKIYSIIIFLIVITLFAQYILYLVGNRPTMLLMPGMTLNYNGGVNSSEFMSYTLGRINTGYYYRPCSIFIEPGFQSMFCAPWLALKLFYGKEKKWKEILVALIVTITMILTTSSMGILCALVIWMLFVVNTFSPGDRRNIKTVLLILPFLIVAGIYLYGVSGVSTSIAIKMKSLQNINGSSSLTWRLLRGVECFKQIGLFQQIFGCGYGDLTSYFNLIHLTTKYDINLTLIDYMNGISYLFCSIGIVGSILLFNIVVKYFPRYKTKIETKILFVCLLIIMFSAAVFDTDKYFLYIGLIMCTALNCDKDTMLDEGVNYV